MELHVKEPADGLVDYTLPLQGSGHNPSLYSSWCWMLFLIPSRVTVWHRRRPWPAADGHKGPSGSPPQTPPSSLILIIVGNWLAGDWLVAGGWLPTAGCLAVSLPGWGWLAGLVGGWSGRGPEEAQRRPRRSPEEAQKARGVVQPWAAVGGRGQPWAAVGGRGQPWPAVGGRGQL